MGRHGLPDVSADRRVQEGEYEVTFDLRPVPGHDYNFAHILTMRGGRMDTVMSLRRRFFLAVLIVSGIIGFAFTADWGNRVLHSVISRAGDDNP
jgi:hypothetical protein